MMVVVDWTGHQKIGLVVATHQHCLMKAVGSFLMAVGYTNWMVVSQTNWTMMVSQSHHLVAGRRRQSLLQSCLRHYLEVHIGWMVVLVHLDFHLDFHLAGAEGIVDLELQMVLFGSKRCWKKINTNGKEIQLYENITYHHVFCVLLQVQSPSIVEVLLISTINSNAFREYLRMTNYENLRKRQKFNYLI